MTEKADKLAAAVDESDEGVLRRIHERYWGQFDKLNFEDRLVTEQLALDLGLLIGMCARLLSERDRAQADAGTKASGYIVKDRDGQKSITCLTCNLESFNRNDVEQRYCGKCHKFHHEGQ